MSKQVPSPGRVVHFVMDSGQYVGEHRPAMVIKSWSDTCVQLAVFIDGFNDYPFNPLGDSLLRWVTSVQLDESENPAPRTWHWPEYVPPRAVEGEKA